MVTPKLSETALYVPVKQLLEGQGYEVKGEVGAADIVAVRDREDPVIVELKTSFSLTLYHQAIDRQHITDAVYIAVPKGSGKVFSKALGNNKKLCRRLGLGLMVVRISDGFVEILLDPAPYKPRQVSARKERLLKEFAQLVGDPNTGGATRRRLITAYRQDALRCIKLLNENGPTKAAEVAQISGVAKAQRIMSDNHYGWFERVKVGTYALSPKGQNAVCDYAAEITTLSTSSQCE